LYCNHTYGWIGFSPLRFSSLNELSIGSYFWKGQGGKRTKGKIRGTDARQPNEKELNATGIVSIKIDEASAKIRTGSPKDDDEDLDLPVWAGVIPISQNFNVPENDQKLSKDIVLPDYIREKIK